MSMDTSITIQLKRKTSPKQILRAFIDNGYSYIYDGDVSYVEPQSLLDESFDWQLYPAESFDIEAFIDKLKQDDPTAMSLSKDEFHASLLIYPDNMLFIIEVPDDIPFLDAWDFQDFSWCLNKVAFLADLVEPESIDCLVSK